MPRSKISKSLKELVYVIYVYFTHKLYLNSNIDTGVQNFNIYPSDLNGLDQLPDFYP